MGIFRRIPDDAFGSKPIVRIRDIDAVVHNYKLFKQKADLTNSICGVVLKADVHGLQMKDVAPALYLEGVRYYFIEELCEGIELRKILPYEDAKIYAMAGLLHGEEKYFWDSNVAPCLNSLEQLERWNNFCGEHGKASSIIHLDTHMNRLGFLDDQILILSKNFKSLTCNINIDFFMSHFYDIKGIDHTNCYKQFEILNGYLKTLPPIPVTFSCTDSVILLDNKVFNLDMIRPGIGLVGGAPNADNPVSSSAKHTMEIYAKISQIKNVKKGEHIGYGGAYTAKRDTIIALVHIGYKDGYLRVLSELDNNPQGVYMYIDKYKLPIIGKVSLGVTTVDVTDVPTSVLKEFQYVEVIGPNVDIKFLADKAGSYEVLAALGRPNLKIADYTLRKFQDLFDKSIQDN